MKYWSKLSGYVFGFLDHGRRLSVPSSGEEIFPTDEMTISCFRKI